MNDQRFLLGLVVGAAIVLSVGVALTMIGNAPVAASESLPRPTPVPMDAPCLSSDPIPPGASANCPDPSDQPRPDSNAARGGEPELPPVSQMNNAGGAAGYGFGSDPIPEGVSPEDTSPPDFPPSPATPGEAAVPFLSYNASLRIVGAALKPRESNVEWTGVSGAGGCIYASSGNSYAVFNAPVYLPQGATVKYFRMYYNDQNASMNSQAWFTVYDLYGEVVQEWSVSSTGTGKSYQTTAEFTHTVNYDSYSYVVNWRPEELGSDMQLCGFRIYYHTPPGALYLPSVMKDAP